MSKESHDQIAGVARACQARYDKIWYRKALELLNLSMRTDGLRVLELGSGNAEFAELLRNSAGALVTCVDYSDAAVEMAKQKGFPAFKLDLEKDPGADQIPGKGSYDLVVMLEVIEHVFDTDALLQFSHAMLKTGGSLLITTPNMAFSGYRAYSMLNGNIPFGQGHHVAFFDEKRLKEFAFFNGFDTARAAKNHYRGNWPLERICTGRTHIPRWLGQCLSTLFTCGPLGVEGLVMLFAKEDVVPLGMSWERIKGIIGKCTPEQQDNCRSRLARARKYGFDAEHPWLAGAISQLIGKK